MVDKRGRAYVAGEGGALLVYEPGADSLRELPERLPGGGYLRATTRPAPDGTVYGVTEAPDRFFALGSDGHVRALGDARGYTASVALDPDGSRFFYVPGAHGDAFEQGTPVVEVDTATGEQQRRDRARFPRRRPPRSDPRRQLQHRDRPVRHAPLRRAERGHDA